MFLASDRSGYAARRELVQRLDSEIYAHITAPARRREGVLMLTALIRHGLRRATFPAGEGL